MPGVRRRKDNKPIPATGPGSRVISLPHVVRRHCIPILSITPEPSDDDEEDNVDILSPSGDDGHSSGQKGISQDDTAADSQDHQQDQSPPVSPAATPPPKKPRKPPVIKGYELRYSTTSSKAIPEEFYKNEELQNVARLLDAPNNRFRKLPAEIGQLSALETINVHNNSISKLPASVGRIPVLRSLDISSNTLKSLPAAMSHASALTEVRASHNRLRGVPARLPASLEALDLSDNAVRRLKRGVYRVPMSLNVSGNRLSDLPPVKLPGRGTIASLRALDASHNRIEKLPATIERLVRLVDLDLADNRLTEIPASVAGMRALRRLNISRNRLTELPDDLCSRLDYGLIELRAAGNSITSMPPSVGKFRRLTVLDLAGNQLTGDLPSDIGEIESLERLDLSSNHLTKVSPVVRLGKLEHLLVADNEIEDLPDNEITGMRLTYRSS